jgi:hypothetical protein
MTKAQLSSGIANLHGGGAEPDDFLTWHNQLPYRIWIHSRRHRGAFRPISIDIQWVGEQPKKVDPSELAARLQVASLNSGDASTADLGPTTFRGIALGQILELHSSAVTDRRMKSRVKAAKKVQLVKNIEIEEFVTQWVDKTNSWQMRPRAFNGTNLGASMKDSIFISYIYAEQVKSGQLKPAKRTAELLGIPTQTVYVAVRTARKKKWLSETKSSGASGGTLTKEGEVAFREHGGQSLYEMFLSSMLNKGK